MWVHSRSRLGSHVTDGLSPFLMRFGIGDPPAKLRLDPRVTL